MFQVGDRFCSQPQCLTTLPVIYLRPSDIGMSKLGIQLNSLLKPVVPAGEVKVCIAVLPPQSMARGKLSSVPTSLILQASVADSVSSMDGLMDTFSMESF
jgi:hypothetical protein